MSVTRPRPGGGTVPAAAPAAGPAGTWPAVLVASRLPVLRVPFLGLVTAALALVGASAPVLDDGYALLVLRGVAVMLAAALTVATDDPAGEVLAAAPVPRPVRTVARVAAGLAVVTPVWALAVGVARWRFEPTPVAGLSLEAAALAAVAVAAGTVLRARGLTTPSWPALCVVTLGAMALHTLPARYAMAVNQPWGPPWHAAQLRWTALLLLGVAVVALAARDPLAGQGRRHEASGAPTENRSSEPARRLTAV